MAQIKLLSNTHNGHNNGPIQLTVSSCRCSRNKSDDKNFVLQRLFNKLLVDLLCKRSWKLLTLQMDGIESSMDESVGK